MRRFLTRNPLDILNEESHEKLRELEECEDLDLSKAVEILDLDPMSDFRFSDLSGVSFKNTDISKFDFTGANLNDSHFDGAFLDLEVDSSLSFMRILQIINNRKEQNRHRATKKSGGMALKIEHIEGNRINDIADALLMRFNTFISSLDGLRFLTGRDDGGRFAAGEDTIVSVQLEFTDVNSEELRKFLHMVNSSRNAEKIRIFISDLSDH